MNVLAAAKRRVLVSYLLISDLLLRWRFNFWCWVYLREYHFALWLWRRSSSWLISRHVIHENGFRKDRYTTVIREDRYM